MGQMTGQDIAKLAGVSRSTVSRVINHYPNVPEETRQRVMAVIEQYNYAPQYSGQLLNGFRAKTLGLFMAQNVVPEIFNRLGIGVIGATASRRGYPLLCYHVQDTRNKAEMDMVYRFFQEGRIDGGIFIGFPDDTEMLEQLERLGKKAVVCNSGMTDTRYENVMYANIDVEPAKTAVDYLWDRGHRKVAFLGGCKERYLGNCRFRVLRQAMASHGAEITDSLVDWGGIHTDGCTEAALRLLNKGRKAGITAVCAETDTTAKGVYQACRQLGLRIPEDISVISCEGLEKRSDSIPTLTRLHYDMQSMVQDMTERLIDAIEGKMVPSLVMTGAYLDESSSVRKR